MKQVNLSLKHLHIVARVATVFLVSVAAHASDFPTEMRRPLLEEEGNWEWFEDRLEIVSEYDERRAFRRCSGDFLEPTCIVFLRDHGMAPTPISDCDPVYESNQIPIGFTNVGLVINDHKRNETFIKKNGVDCEKFEIEDAWFPKLSPKNDALAFSDTYRSGHQGLRVFDLSTRKTRLVTPYPKGSVGVALVAWVPSHSPERFTDGEHEFDLPDDDERLVFLVSRDHSTLLDPETWSVRLDGAGLSLLAKKRLSKSTSDVKGFGYRSLQFPLRCWSLESGICHPQYFAGPYTIASPDKSNPGIITSLLDHHQNKAYSEDGYVLAFDGSKRGTGVPEDQGSYPEYSRPPITLGGLYRGTMDSGYRAGLNYDGHPGYDYYAEYGVPVFASSGGWVIDESGQRCVPYGISKTGGCTAWGYVGIKNLGGLITQYGHLSEIYVKPGETVYAGTMIGRVGNTSPFPMSAHLHFEVLYPSDKCSGGYCIIDPYGWTDAGQDDPLESPRKHGHPLWTTVE